MKKILVPTDFSDHAKKAYIIAAAIAKENNATIYLYHMIQSWFTGSVAYTGYDIAFDTTIMDKASKDKSLKEIKELAESSIFNGIDVKTEVELTYTNNKIEPFIEEINSMDFDLIAIGTSGHDEKHESFAEVAARNSKCPVITCYKEIEAFEPKSILLTTDFDTLNAGFFKRLREVTKDEDVKKTILYVNTKKNFLTTKEINHGFNVVRNKYKLTNTELLVINSETVLEGINDVVEQNEFDLVSVATHGRKGLSRLFFGSKSNELINICPIPVFSYNMHDFLEAQDKDTTSFRSGFTG